MKTLSFVGCLLLASALCQAASVEKIGTYDFFVDESSPVVYNGKLLMFESIVRNSPEWAGYWLPDFQNCSCYYRVRDLASTVVIINITETCNHAFGAAIVYKANETSPDEFWIFGTNWIRDNTPERLGWTPICPNNVCAVDAFSSTDPTLQTWSSFIGAAPIPSGTVYNNDVTFVPAPTTELAKKHRANLPEFQWIMAIEGNSKSFMYSNSSEPSSGWTVAPFPAPPQADDSCPAFRYNPATGYFYYLSGGMHIYISRTTDLVNWETSSTIVLEPDTGDCEIINYHNISHYTPSAEAEALLEKCTKSPKGFGNDSDVDLCQITNPDGTPATLFVYGSGDQATFGFSNLAIQNGAIFDVLDSFFD